MYDNLCVESVGIYLKVGNPRFLNVFEKNNLIKLDIFDTILNSMLTYLDDFFYK